MSFLFFFSIENCSNMDSWWSVTAGIFLWQQSKKSQDEIDKGIGSEESEVKKS